MALYRHAKRVPHQHDVNAFIGKQFGKAVIVSGDGGEAFLFLFVFLQQGDSGRFAHNFSPHNKNEYNGRIVGEDTGRR